jgi:2-polyprenyl-3-methyl-5-hydroxy-6-metoxy-1,4-benzoquinol methylase
MAQKQGYDDTSKITVYGMQSRPEDFADSMCLDYGSGWGVLAFTALAMKAKHVYVLERDPERLQKMFHVLMNSTVDRTFLTPLEQDGLNDCKGLEGKFDVVMCNPGQYVFPKKMQTHKNWQGADGRLMIESFISNLDRLLKPDGVAYLTHACFSNPFKTVEKLSSQGFTCTAVKVGMLPMDKILQKSSIMKNLFKLPLAANDLVNTHEDQFVYSAICYRICRPGQL